MNHCISWRRKQTCLWLCCVYASVKAEERKCFGPRLGLFLYSRWKFPDAFGFSFALSKSMFRVHEEESVLEKVGPGPLRFHKGFHNGDRDSLAPAVTLFGLLCVLSLTWLRVR